MEPKLCFTLSCLAPLIPVGFSETLPGRVVHQAALISSIMCKRLPLCKFMLLLSTFGIQPRPSLELRDAATEPKYPPVIEYFVLPPIDCSAMRNGSLSLYLYIDSRYSIP
ncbi:hypothetical protein PoB_000228600 [Plakobranchus ocellatus]|uniref:Uncharacterized protein n=1 Tax=Plakobranchus ocellatus TaxID=259542 RepID=A0AAV3XY61_9GAST|nr:hypothetical protein PoB_000228600 [Plakobranchus ocellatus]